MGSTVKVRVGFCVMCIGRELSNNCVSISCSSFPEFYFFFRRNVFPLCLITVFCEEKPQCKSVAQLKKKKSLENCNFKGLDGGD